MEGGNWPVEAEVNLFHAMRGRKPVGVNRHFQMLFIHERINSSAYRKISAQEIWDHLKTMYDLQALNESEILPFPNKEHEFSLPDEEYQDLTSKAYPRVSDASYTEEKSTKVDTPGTGSKSSKSEKTEVKQLENKTITNVSASTPDSSSKRKRTRNTPSEKASPATPDNPPSKRRR